ncbi:hypothetical protein M5689_019653 [Euphorbia peplus]|nr:hypothetical protein M5689_019653 [Euphorbia peplus]
MFRRSKCQLLKSSSSNVIMSNFFLEHEVYTKSTVHAFYVYQMDNFECRSRVFSAHFYVYRASLYVYHMDNFERRTRVCSAHFYAYLHFYVYPASMYIIWTILSTGPGSVVHTFTYIKRLSLTPEYDIGSQKSSTKGLGEILNHHRRSSKFDLSERTAPRNNYPSVLSSS